MKKYLVLALMLTILTLTSGCKGVLTGHEYTSEEIGEISQFLSVSKNRLEMYKNGDITIEELGVSADRLREATEFIKGE